LANTALKLYAGTPSTSSATLFTSPTSTKTIVKCIVIGNTTSTVATITLGFAGTNLITAYSVDPNDTVTIDLSLVLEASETITGLQGTASALNVHISGVEVA
jgi:hypothetical protein